MATTHAWQATNLALPTQAYFYTVRPFLNRQYSENFDGYTSLHDILKQLFSPLRFYFCLIKLLSKTRRN